MVASHRLPALQIHDLALCDSGLLVRPKLKLRHGEARLARSRLGLGESSSDLTGRAAFGRHRALIRRDRDGFPRWKLPLFHPSNLVNGDGKTLGVTDKGRLNDKTSFICLLHPLLCPTPDFVVAQKLVREIWPIAIWISQITERITSSIGISEAVPLFGLFIESVRIIQRENRTRIPERLVRSLIREEEVMIARQSSGHQRFSRSSFPNDLVAKILCTKNSMHQHPQIVTRCRVAVKVQTSVGLRTR